jgi:hypothetical protein
VHRLLPGDVIARVEQIVREAYLEEGVDVGGEIMRERVWHSLRFRINVRTGDALALSKRNAHEACPRREDRNSSGCLMLRSICQLAQAEKSANKMYHTKRNIPRPYGERVY